MAFKIKVDGVDRTADVDGDTPLLGELYEPRAKSPGRSRKRRAAPTAGAGACALTWILPDLKPEVLERAAAAQIYGPSLPPRRDLQYPCRLLPWPAEARVAARSSPPRLAVRECRPQFGN